METDNDTEVPDQPGAEPAADVDQDTQDQAQDPEQPELEQEPEQEPEPEYPVVGELRRLKVYGISTNYKAELPIGEAWQDETGQLFGTGICQIMLFEPLSNIMYRNSASGMDTSPLSILALRISMSQFVRIEWEDADAQ